MITRQVTLHSGLKIGADQVKLATIREETLDDEMVALEAGLSGDALNRFISMRRVAKIGMLDEPDPSVLRKLSRVDWDLIETALSAMDLELATNAGLLLSKRGAPEADDARGAAPGHA